MTRAALLILAALLGGCGKQAALTRLPGMSPVPRAANAPVAETPAALIEPTTQARPKRDIDLLSRSEPRADDPFDLPPSADNGRPPAPRPQGD